MSRWEGLEWSRDANNWEERSQQWQTDDSLGHNQGGCSRGWNDWNHEEGVKPGMGGKMMGGKVGQATKKLQETMLSSLLKVVLLMVRSFRSRG